MIKLYLYRLGGFLNKASLNSKAEKNKLISKTAYELISERLTELTGEAPAIKKTDRGKPYIVDLPYHISISHCDDAVLFAISDDVIGVDIERPREFSDHAKKRIFSENEKKYISNGDENKRSTVLWTMREAVCKATGEGMSQWFFDCSFANEASELVTEYDIYNLRVIEISDYICTLASVSSFDDIMLFDEAL